MLAPKRGLKTFLSFSTAIFALTSCSDQFPLFVLHEYFPYSPPTPSFMFFLRHSHQYMTTAKGRGFLSFTKTAQAPVNTAATVNASLTLTRQQRRFEKRR
jgi:hypothetical protein